MKFRIRQLADHKYIAEVKRWYQFKWRIICVGHLTLGDMASISKRIESGNTENDTDKNGYGRYQVTATRSYDYAVRTCYGANEEKSDALNYIKRYAAKQGLSEYELIREQG